MWWVNLIAILILIGSFVGGIKDGAVKALFGLVLLIISIPLAGLSYHLLSDRLTFLPGENWPNLVGFFVTMAIINILLNLVFLLPRRALEKAWGTGFVTRPIGGLLSAFGSAIGLVVFTLAVVTYPVWEWAKELLTGSGVLTWLVSHLGFVQSLLPEVFRHTGL